MHLQDFVVRLSVNMKEASMYVLIEEEEKRETRFATRHGHVAKNLVPFT
jgi:hypothetical protein